MKQNEFRRRLTFRLCRNQNQKFIAELQETINQSA